MLAKQITRTNPKIAAFSLHPGYLLFDNFLKNDSNVFIYVNSPIMTNLQRHMVKDNNPWYIKLLSTVFLAANDWFSAFKTIPEGSATQFYLCVENKKDLVSGAYYEDVHLSQCQLRDIVDNADLANLLQKHTDAIIDKYV